MGGGAFEPDAVVQPRVGDAEEGGDFLDALQAEVVEQVGGRAKRPLPDVELKRKVVAEDDAVDNEVDTLC